MYAGWLSLALQHDTTDQDGAGIGVSITGGIFIKEDEDEDEDDANELETYRSEGANIVTDGQDIPDTYDLRAQSDGDMNLVKPDDFAGVGVTIESSSGSVEGVEDDNREEDDDEDVVKIIQPVDGDDGDIVSIQASDLENSIVNITISNSMMDLNRSVADQMMNKEEEENKRVTEDTQSDIEVISDDIGLMDEVFLSNLDSSTIFNQLPLCPLMSTGITRSYTHTPNKRFNWRLNLSVLVAVTAVIGLGIGNYLANSNKPSTEKNHVSTAQVMKLMNLQDELLDCLERHKSETNVSFLRC